MNLSQYKENREWKKKYLAESGVNPLWDWVGYAYTMLLFVWLWKRYESLWWLVVGVALCFAQFLLDIWFCEKMKNSKDQDRQK